MPIASRRALVALGLLLAAVLLAWSFDWNWLRPVIRHVVMSRSGRSFEFDQLRVSIDRHLDPTVEFRNLRVQNAPWAARDPLIRAGLVRATFDGRSLFGSQTLIRMLVLRDADIDLERQADGLRNWRLAHPDDRGPPQLKVMALDALDSRLRTVHQGIGLEARAAISALPAPEVLPGHPELPLARRLVFGGNYLGRPFEGEAATSAILTFGLSDERFALRGVGTLAGLRLDAAGTATDIHAMGDVDLQVRLGTQGDGDLWPLPLRAGLARARPLKAAGHVTKVGKEWRATGLEVAFGRASRLGADLAITDDRDSGRARHVRATIADARLDVRDLGAMAGHAPAAPASAPAQRVRTLSPEALDTAKLRNVDGEVTVRDARFAGAERNMAESLAFHATLQQGRLAVDALDIGLARGRVTGGIQLDASRSPADIDLALKARGLRLDRLSQAVADKATLLGQIDADLALRARGDSVRDFATSAAGTLRASLAPGASVTKRLDAKLSLDGGAWLRSLVGGNDRVPVRCGSVAIDLEAGQGVVRSFSFETDRTALAGRGRISLVDESIDATVMPIRKERALFTLDRSLHATGPWREIKVALGPPVPGATPSPCPGAR